MGENVVLNSILWKTEIVLYSKVWNKRTPLNKHTPWKKSGQKNKRTPLNKHKYPLIRPYPQEKIPKINKRSATLITDPRVYT